MPARRRSAEIPDGAVRTQRELAKLLGVSTRRARELLDDGMPRGDGFYVVADCVQWYRDRGVEALKKKQRSSARGSESTTTDLDAEIKQLRIELDTLKLERERGQLISLEDVEAGWAKRCQIVQRDLMALGDRVAPQLEGLDVHERAALIKRHCAHICESYAAGEEPWLDD